MIDAIVDRRELRDYIAKLLNFMMNPEIHGESDIERARRAAKLKDSHKKAQKHKQKRPERIVNLSGFLFCAFCAFLWLMNFEAAVQYLLSLGHETLTIKLGLRNTELLLNALDNPERAFPSVQIAGTNGKGSTAAMLESICRAAGIKCGLYTSPHLVSITERIKSPASR